MILITIKNRKPSITRYRISRSAGNAFKNLIKSIRPDHGRVFNIFIGKRHHLYDRLFLGLSEGFLWFGGNAKVTAIRFLPTSLPTGRQAYRIIVRLNKD